MADEIITGTESKKSKVSKLRKEVKRIEESNSKRFAELEEKINQLSHESGNNKLFLTGEERTISEMNRKLSRLEAKVNQISLANQNSMNQNTDQTVENKKGQLKKASNKFFSNNSIYGLSRAFSTKKKLNKIIWTICALISATYGFVIIAENYLEYHQYDVLTKTETIEQNTAVFPTIILCPGKLASGVFEVISLYQNIGLSTFTLNQSLLEYSADSGDCIRFNAHSNNSNPLMTVNGIKSRYSFNFKIKFHDYFIIYIGDNFVNSYLIYDKFNLDPNLSYQFKITKTVEIKQEEPYNHCTDVSDPTYRQIDCQQKCIYKRYAAKYNCSFISFRCFLANEFSVNRCFDEKSEDRVKYKSGLSDFSVAAITEFGADCLNICPKECIKVKYSTEITTRTNTTQDPLYENETTFSFYFSDLNYVETSQIPKVTLSSLISNIGGALGAFIGLNFLSIVELVEFIVEIIYTFC